MATVSGDNLRARAKAVFQDVVEAEAGDRAELLARLCGADADLRREVQALLRAADSAGDAFNAPATGAAAAAAVRHDEIIGTTIGPYKVLELIGEGGFGAVYMVEQMRPVVRRVALKIIKLGMDTRQVIARFEAERQALAMMDHPNIARVLDAGATDTGRPFFVMELVRGIPITRYCDENGLTPRQRLELFIPVCLAVQHAHTKGIIHRDIKPSNVLVTVADGRPIAKVIDFGIAKATGRRLTDKTLFTEFRQLIGTPEYMSPEQAETHGVDVDARTDIYSLGVLLYELLTGTTPFDSRRLRSASFDELHRIIREEEPQRPSIRVSRSHTGAPRSPDRSPTSLESVARCRGTDPHQLSRSLRGELDWIILRAIDKDRSRRYETANALAQDIQRFLRDEPVYAGPPSAAYRLRKFIRRNRVAFSAGVAILAALVFGLGAALYGLSRASQERNEKEEAYLAEAGHRLAAENARTAEEEARRLADLRAAEARRQAYRANLRAAAAALAIGDQQNALHSLAAAPEDLRGWEWAYVAASADRSIRTIPTPTGIPLAPSESFEAHVNGDGYFLAWSPRTAEFRRLDGRVLRFTFPESIGWIDTCTVSPYADVALVNGAFEKYLVDLRSGAYLQLPLMHFQQNAAAFTADGRSFVAACMAPPRVAVFDARSGAELRSFPLPTSQFKPSATVSPDGSRIAVEIADGITGLLDAATGEVQWTAHGIRPRFGPDGARLYVLRGVLGPAPSLVALNAATGVELGRIDIEGCPISNEVDETDCIALSPDSALIAIVERSGLIRVYDARTFAPLGLLSGLSSGNTVAFTRDSRRLLASERGGQVKVWDAAVHNTPLHATPTGMLAGMVNFSAAALSPDRRHTFTGDWGRIMLWDTTTGAPIWSRFHSFEYIAAVAWRPDGRLVAAAGDRGTLFIIDPADGALLASSMPLGYGDVGSSLLRAVAWSPDGGTLHVAGERGEVVACNADSLSISRPIGRIRGPVLAIRAAPDGRSLAVAGPNEGVVLFSLLPDADGSPLWRAPADNAAALTFSPDGTRIAAGARDAAFVLNAATGSIALNLESAPGEYTAFAFSADASRIAGARADRRVQFWSASHGEELLTLDAEFFRDLAFLPDGSALVGCGLSPTVRFEVVTPPGDVLARRERLRRAAVLIAELAPSHVYAAVVADAVASRAAEDPEVRDAALHWLHTVGVHAAALNNVAFIIAAQRNPDRLDVAVRNSELALARCRDAFAINTLAIIRYRQGRYAESLAAIEEAERAFIATRPNWGDGHPVLEAFRCMSLFRLGRMDEARRSLDHLRRLMAEDRFSAIPAGRDFLAEAEELAAGS